MDRRTFLSFVTVAAGAAAAALVGVPVLGRVLAPLRRSAGDGPEFQSVGPLDAFEPGRPTRVGIPVTVRDGWDVSTQVRAAWVVRTSDDEAQVLSAVCPHLGCAVKWAAEKSEFACPCHRSGFALDGARRHGPARRGLDALPVRIVGRDVQVQWVDYVANVAEKREAGGA